MSCCSLTRLRRFLKKFLRHCSFSSSICTKSASWCKSYFLRNRNLQKNCETTPSGSARAHYFDAAAAPCERARYSAVCNTETKKMPLAGGFPIYPKSNQSACQSKRRRTTCHQRSRAQGNDASLRSWRVLRRGNSYENSHHRDRLCGPISH